MTWIPLWIGYFLPKRLNKSSNLPFYIQQLKIIILPHGMHYDFYLSIFTDKAQWSQWAGTRCILLIIASLAPCTRPGTWSIFSTYLLNK